jgi:hypothetical protein
MSQSPRPTAGLFTQLDITAGAGYPKTGPTGAPQDEQTFLLRSILAGVDRHNELLEEMLTHMQQSQKQRGQELNQWKQANPMLAESCRHAAEALSKVQVEYLNTITQEVEDNADYLTDGEFALNEFVDRFGPRLAHLNGVLQVLAQLASIPPQTASPAEPS